MSPDLHGVESVNICGGMFRNEIQTSTSHCLLLPSPTTILFDQRASERQSVGIDGLGRIRNDGKTMVVFKYY
jgi:hypothetical protein